MKTVYMIIKQVEDSNGIFILALHKTFDAALKSIPNHLGDYWPIKNEQAVINSFFNYYMSNGLQYHWVNSDTRDVISIVPMEVLQ
jgi:hypothetical protein